MLERTNVAVVGGDGVIGSQILSALFDRGLPSEKVTVLGTERSAGEELEYGDDTLEVEKYEAGVFRGMGVVFLAVPPDSGRTLAHEANSAGAWVVDVSPAFHEDATVPMVLPPLNGDLLASAFLGRIVTVPSPIITALALALEPLRQRFGIAQIQATALLGASSSGQRGITELEKQTADLLSGREIEPVIFPHRLAFNVIPQVGLIDPATGLSAGEQMWVREWKRLLEGRGEVPPLSITGVQIPTFFGHLLSVSALLQKPNDLRAIREAFAGNPHVKLLDAPEERVYPMPMLVTSDPAVHVGRIRLQEGAPGWVQLVVAIDNAGRGAALTAVEAAERLLSRA